MPMWGRTDTPLDNDSVERRKIAPYALGLEDFICNCETPMTVGIQGEWGSGRTSLMRRIQQRLEPAPGERKGRSATPPARSDHHKKVMTFWFDTWQYGAVGHADHLGLLLMRDLSSKLIANLKDRDMVFALTQRMSDCYRRLLPAVMSGAITTATKGMVDGQTLVRGPSGSGGDSSDDMRNAFGKLVETALASNKCERLIVFVDDLDRIPPARAVRL
ncbi:MAG: P-loop NTPase fold protein, partial [Myxococcota bacterium]|nr:P-loop NTPase fold protein [Myxococcota bacterium]